MTHNIAFPKLGIAFSVNEIAIPLPFGSGGIRWYALCILTGVLLGFCLAVREMKRLGEDTDHLYNLILWGLPFGVLGARLYYVLFSWEAYRDNLWSVFYIWEGGIAIYGAVIAVIFVVLIYCKQKKLSLWRYLDIGAYGFLAGQCIGRWGNFINGEAYGTPTELPWQMLVDGFAAHPTFLYESLWNLLGLLILWFTRKKYEFDGRAATLYMIWYGIGRFWIEGFRTDSLMLGDIRISKLLSLVFIILGVVLYAKRKKQQSQLPENL